jgi:superfamily II DNA or RNA helicase
MSRTKEILDAIANEEARLAGIEEQRRQSRQRLDDIEGQKCRLNQRLIEIEERRRQSEERLASLRTELDGIATAHRSPGNLPAVTTGSPPRNTAEKLDLFRRLFRGRTDVFAKFWSNPRTGKSGFAPACFNEWVHEVCKKPAVRCGECPNRSFIPLDDRVILDHMLGRHTIGVYPLLANETCWFLAADFDKQSWREDIAAFLETCRMHDLEPSVERSRSGKGGHVWFFFSSPVKAGAARAMGCWLITETMARRHQLGMESYDRLFPNQDTMPEGGFGNLIALPFQNGPRQKGNTIFVDDGFKPYTGQWDYLASVRRIDPRTIAKIAREAKRRGNVIGRLSCGEGEETDSVQTCFLSGEKQEETGTAPIPNEIHAIFAERIYIRKEGLPPALLNRMKRLAAFQNPEFYRRQRMRLSTFMTPRIICCAEESPRHMILPRGCITDLENILRAHGISLVIEDGTNTGDALDVRFRGRLTQVQKEAVESLLKHNLGVFVAPAGVGKTIVGIYLISERRANTLILVHRRPLLEQWQAQVHMFLDIDPKSVGRIGGGRNRPSGRIDVAMIQSLTRKGEVDDLVTGYGHVIMDECHHVPAVSFERVLSRTKARYVTGLTATPTRRDGLHPIIRMQCGPMRYTVDPRSQAARRPFTHRLIVRETGFNPSGIKPNPRIQELYALIAADEKRNGMILDDVIGAIEEGRSPILLTERRDHLEYLAGRLRGVIKHLIVLRGGISAKKLSDAKTQLAAVPENEERLIIATGRYIGEGFDDTRLDTLFLAMPVSWKGTLVQYTGRLHRRHPEKTEVCIYDYLDSGVPVLRRMFEKRLKGYRAIGYERDDDSASNHEARSDELTLELD